jgi:hypothetical protein
VEIEPGQGIAGQFGDQLVIELVLRNLELVSEGAELSQESFGCIRP